MHRIFRFYWTFTWNQKKLKSKHILKKILKFTLKFICFAYTRIMDFPNSDFLFNTFFLLFLCFEGWHCITTVKLHVHHSHAKGKIWIYAHDFCNQKVREIQKLFSCLSHNFFSFDFHFVLKGIRLSVWKKKDLNIGGTNLTNLNFANIHWYTYILPRKPFSTIIGSYIQKEIFDKKTQSRIFSNTWQFSHYMEKFGQKTSRKNTWFDSDR